jgi:adenylate kinase
LILLGAPGVGKGTQANLLAKRYEIPSVSTGDMLRAAMSEGTPLGDEAKAFVTRGDLVPDAVIIRVVEDRLSRADAQTGFLLDGFPRTISQAQSLDMLLQDKGYEIDAAIAIDVPDQVLIGRLGSRLTCRSCASVFGLDAELTEQDACPNCGGQLYVRPDDQPEAIRRRLAVYRESTEPLLDYYRGQGVLKIVDGDRTRDEVAASIEAALSA